MNKYTRRATVQPAEIRDLYSKYNLKENPFPYNPFIEPESEDPKRNGKIFDENIRLKELKKFKESFLLPPLTGDHNRIGYLLESSFTGRGNGKSAFLVNIQNSINSDFSATVSNNLNKAFSIYIKAKASGHNAKFWQISQEIIKELANKKIFEDGLIALRYEVLEENDWSKNLNKSLNNEEDYKNLLDNGWLLQKGINFPVFHQKLKQKMIAAGISSDLADLLSSKSDLASKNILQKFIEEKQEPWKKKELNRFLFDELARFFILCGFNGCYILLDEFEKIADFQKPAERIEFAYELRQCVLESNLQSGITGFFIFIITMHPGTQRLILESWEKSGINARSPLPGEDFMEAPHVITFEDIKKQDISALVKIYLDFYRIDKENPSDLYPFDEEAINIIAEVSKYNAARILKFSHLLLSELIQSEKKIIDKEFVMQVVTKNKKFPLEDINSSNFLNRDNNPLENAMLTVQSSPDGV